MQDSSKSDWRRRLLLTLTLLGMVGALIAVPKYFPSKAGAQLQKGLITPTRSHDPEIPNYDIRTAKENAAADALVQYRNQSGKSAFNVAEMRDQFVRGEEMLTSRIPHSKVEYNSDIRIPEVITPDVWRMKMSYLSGPNSGKRSEVLRSFAKEYNMLIGMEPGQLDDLKVTSDYTNPSGNMSFAHLEQRINDVPVFRGEIKAGFTPDGKIVRVINNLAPGLDYSSLSMDFGDPSAAVRAAAATIKRDVLPSDVTLNDAASTDLVAVFGDGGDRATTAEKMYFPTEPGVAVPAWRVLIWGKPATYYVIVDAHTGTMLWRKNLTEEQTQTATYEVYHNPNAYVLAADSPAPLSPGPINPTLGTQGLITSRTNITLIGNEGDLSFNNNGWMTDGVNKTDGNAVQAGLDVSSPDGVDTGSEAVGDPNRVFSSTWNPPPGNPAPGDAPTTAQARRGAVIQMFYVMNRYHDALYKLGFNEASRNFQQDNFGRGGNGNDRVSAEGQDFSGTDNAFFTTPADGGRGVMEMFVWTGPTPDYDGTTDAEVIIHEVTHGTSNRLHGNASGLSTNMSRGMGEGWGDFYGYSLLAEPTDPINAVYTTGGYATYLITGGFTANYYYGIRRFPRAPIAFLGPNGKPYSPFTFRYLNSDCNTLIGTTSNGPNSAYPRGPVGVSQCDQVHNAGEVWSSTLWEVRNIMVARLGFANGTRDVLQAVTDGMKLAPLGPTFLQERDAIIAAAQTQSSQHAADVREGFRRRGMGFFASIQSTSPAAVTENFDAANAILANPFEVDDSTGNNNGVPEPGENVLLSIPVSNNTGVTVNNVTVSVNGGTPVDYGDLSDGETVTMEHPFAISASAECGSTVTVSIVVSSDTATNEPAERSFVLGTPVGVVENFDGVSAPTLPAGWTMTQDTGTGISWTTVTAQADSAPNSAFAPDVASINMASLVSPSIPVTSSAAQIKFRNFYNTESTFDGVVLELKIGSGSWQDILAAGGSFASGGYNSTISTAWQSPIAGRQAWSGNSGGFINTVANLPAAANGQNVQLRIRMASDVSVAATGVWIDNFEAVSSFNCAPVEPTTGSARADFDGDGKTDVSVYRPASGTWYVNQSTDGFMGLNFGASTDALAPGDFDGDGKADFAVYRGSNNPSDYDMWILKSSDFTLAGGPWGVVGDIPVVGDYNGDGVDDVAVYRDSDATWYISYSGITADVIQFGVTGDIPVSGDYDGDGKTDVAVFRPSDHTWYVRPSSNPSVTGTAFGASGDMLVPGDYDGDGKTDMATFRSSEGTWYIRKSSDGSATVTQFGANGDVPAPGDYDGDGKEDVAVVRNGTWWINGSTSGLMVQLFGFGTDKPIPSADRP